MKMIDNNSGLEFSLQDVYDNWEFFRTEDPFNHSAVFQTEFFTLLMDTINGRNDFDVIGPTQDELERFIIRLHDHQCPASPWKEVV